MSDEDYSCVCSFDIMVFCHFGYLCVVLALERPNPMKCIEMKILGIMFWKVIWYEDRYHSCVCRFDILVLWYFGILDIYVLCW
jgi:hypothetical protein